ncbi:MAG: hypothetical protein H7336_05275 [Bacteriovorax sp.]|nr:hypothetical protein [Bacteriovorax sp.]
MYSSHRPPITILDQFTPEVQGIFWVTRDDLSRELIGFDDFNYLFDGLISQYLYGQENNNDKHAHIFFTKNYDHKIFLAHLKTKEHTKSQVAGDIDEQLALIKAGESEKKVILVFDNTDDHWFPELKKRYPQFEFKELTV